MTWLLWEAAKSYTDAGSSLPSCLLQVSVGNVVKFISFEHGDANHAWNQTNIKQIIETSTISPSISAQGKIHLPKSSQIPSFFQGTRKTRGLLGSFSGHHPEVPWHALVPGETRINPNLYTSHFRRVPTQVEIWQSCFFPVFFPFFWVVIRECPCSLASGKKKTDRCFLRFVARWYVFGGGSILQDYESLKPWEWESCS